MKRFLHCLLLAGLLTSLPAPAQIRTAADIDARAFVIGLDAYVYGNGPLTWTADGRSFRAEASGNSVNIGANDQYKSLTATIVATAPDYIDSAPFIYSFDNPVGIHSPQLEDNGPADVYSIDGVLLRQAVSRDKALGNLPAGLYILRTASGSVKVRVK